MNDIKRDDVAGIIFYVVVFGIIIFAAISSNSPMVLRLQERVEMNQKKIDDMQTKLNALMVEIQEFEKNGRK